MDNIEYKYMVIVICTFHCGWERTLKMVFEYSVQLFEYIRIFGSGNHVSVSLESRYFCPGTGHIWILVQYTIQAHAHSDIYSYKCGRAFCRKTNAFFCNFISSVRFSWNFAMDLSVQISHVPGIACR